MTKSRTISRTWRFLCTLLICSIGIASIIGSGSSGGSDSSGGAASQGANQPTHRKSSGSGRRAAESPLGTQPVAAPHFFQWEVVRHRESFWNRRLGRGATGHPKLARLLK